MNPREGPTKSQAQQGPAQFKAQSSNPRVSKRVRGPPKHMEYFVRLG